MSAKRFTPSTESDTLEAPPGTFLRKSSRRDPQTDPGGPSRRGPLAGLWSRRRRPAHPGDRPYNDLNPFVFVRGNALLAERRFRRTAGDSELGERLSPARASHQEFKGAHLTDCAAVQPPMFHYDLVQDAMPRGE